MSDFRKCNPTWALFYLTIVVSMGRQSILAQNATEFEGKLSDSSGDRGDISTESYKHPSPRSVAEALPPVDTQDLSRRATGDSNRDELLASGNYILMSAFGEALSLPIGERSMAKYVPQIVKKKALSRGVEGEFYSSAFEAYYWPRTYEENLRAIQYVTPRDSLKFILFTQNSPPDGEIIDTRKITTIRKSTFNPDTLVKILIHGYDEKDTKTNSAYKLKNAYLKTNYSGNIIIVDWAKLSNDPLYFEAAIRTELVAHELANFILTLVNRMFIPSFDSIHMIGHCLGAHIAGQTGRFIKRHAPGTQAIGRITGDLGLDPSGPGFVYANHEICLDSTDASYVDIIHTNMGVDFGTGHLGTTSDHKGSANFFPNGGRDQPICGGDPLSGDLIDRCSHRKAVDYFERSISGEIFHACLCDSWNDYDQERCICEMYAFMGENLRSVYFGKYFLHVYESSLAEMLGFE